MRLKYSSNCLVAKAGEEKPEQGEKNTLGGFRRLDNLLSSPEMLSFNKAWAVKRRIHDNSVLLKSKTSKHTFRLLCRFWFPFQSWSERLGISIQQTQQRIYDIHPPRCSVSFYIQLRYKTEAQLTSKRLIDRPPFTEAVESSLYFLINGNSNILADCCNILSEPFPSLLTVLSANSFVT